MPILRTDLNENLSTFVVTGQVTFEEAMETLQPFYSGKPSWQVLWDFRQGTMSELPYDKIQIVIEYITHFAHKRAGGKTAVVTATAVDYGVARIFAALIDNNKLPYFFRVFYDYDEAIAWLKSESQG